MWTFVLFAPSWLVRLECTDLTNNADLHHTCRSRLQSVKQHDKWGVHRSMRTTTAKHQVELLWYAFIQAVTPWFIIWSDLNKYNVYKIVSIFPCETVDVLDKVEVRYIVRSQCSKRLKMPSVRWTICCWNVTVFSSDGWDKQRWLYGWYKRRIWGHQDRSLWQYQGMDMQW